MQKEELFAFRTLGMQNIGVGGCGVCEPMCSCHLVSIASPIPCWWAGFLAMIQVPWFILLRMPHLGTPTWATSSNELVKDLDCSRESVAHKWHPSIAFRLHGVSPVPCSECFPLSGLHPLFWELRTRFWTRSGGWIQERCYVASLFPFGSQACGFLFSYENKINGSEAILHSRISEELERQFSELVLPMYKMFYNTDDVPDNEEKRSSKLKSWCPKMPLSRFLLVTEVCWHNRIGIETGQVAT